MNVRFLAATCAAAWLALMIPSGTSARPADAPGGILIITVDDMNCDSVGAFGCRLPDTTPHIDRLASQGLRFEHAHVQVGNCMPSRNVMWSGRYPHNNRVEGFYQIRDPDYPVLCDLMKQRGYFTAIRGKVSHSTPYAPYAWDLVLDDVDPPVHPKNAQSYYESTRRGILASAEARKPFCLMINVSDPHKPFYGMGRGNREIDDPHKPTRVFVADEVPVPGFLPDTPAVRNELAHYYSSVRRADDCVGAILKALAESGQVDNTVVMFLSDHGMPFPFAKTALYHHSTHTPLIVRWPGTVAPNTVDSQHMVSAVDLTPTLLDLADVPAPQGLDGRSFLPLLRGEKQAGRDMVYKVYNENAGGFRNPMRGVSTRRYGYLFNPWADGRRTFRTATTGTATYREMKRLAETDETIAARLELFDHRVVEEFYDYQNDPDALHNLIDDPAHQPEINRLRQALEQFMIQTGDHALDAFRNRSDKQALEQYMARVDRESAERRERRKQARRATNRKRAKQRGAARLIRLQVPRSVSKDQPVVVRVRHDFPESLGEQSIHVTLKPGDNRGRLERQVVTGTGQGELEVTFALPHDCAESHVRVAAFVGKDYASSLQHIVSKPIPVVD